MDEKSNLKDELVAEFKQEPEILDMTPLESIKSLVRQALGYDDLTPIDLTKHISVALRSSTGSNAIAEREAGSDILRFFAAGDYPATSLKVTIVPVQEGTGDPSPENIRPITGWTAVKVYQAAEYDEEGEPVIEVALGDDAGTVYGGVLDVITGVLTVTHRIVDIGGQSWIKEDTDRVRCNISGLAMPQSSAPVCSTFKGFRFYQGFPLDSLPEGTISVTNSLVLPLVRIQYSGIGDDPTIRTGYAVFELAEPITYQLDPEELSTLAGENNIWADCGPVESITY